MRTIPLSPNTIDQMLSAINMFSLAINKDEERFYKETDTKSIQQLRERLPQLEFTSESTRNNIRQAFNHYETFLQSLISLDREQNNRNINLPQNSDRRPNVKMSFGIVTRDGNQFGWDRIDFLEFNYDGQGGAITFADGEITTFSRMDVFEILEGLNYDDKPLYKLAQ